VFHEDFGPQGAGADAVGAAIPDCPGGGPGAVRRSRHPRGAAIPPGGGIEAPAISAIIPVVVWPSPDRHNKPARHREKTMVSSIIRLAGCVAAMSVIGTGFAAAQDCPRGDLDKAYCDRNG